MALRLPQNQGRGDTPSLGALDYEIAQQKAETLGRVGRQVEKVLARLRAIPQDDPDEGQRQRRTSLLDEAAERVWAFMIQRELCGFGHWDAVVRDYAIPREVLIRMGRVTGP